MSDLIERMEDARKGLQLACETDLFSDNEPAKLIMNSLINQIGMWQSDIMRMERETPKAQTPLGDILQGVPRGANYFELSWSPDRHNWRAEIDNMTHTEFQDRRDPIEAIKAVFEKWKIYTDNRRGQTDADYD